MTTLREAAQQALEALEIGWSTTHTGKDARELGMKAITALRAALAQQDEPVKPAPLKRGITGRCTRKVCECEKEGLGPECIYLEPVIDGYPLWSGIPKAEPVEPVAWLAPDGSVRETPAAKSFGEWVWGPDDFRPLYTAPPQRKPLTEEELLNIIDDTLEGGSLVDVARAVERAHGIKE